MGSVMQTFIRKDGGCLFSVHTRAQKQYSTNLSSLHYCRYNSVWKETMVDQPGLSRLTQAGSFGRSSSASSSLRRRSLSMSGAASFRIDDDLESKSVSEAGDIGDRALHSGRLSDAGGSLRLSLDNGLENGAVHSIPENQLLESYGFWSHNQVARNEVSPVSPLPEEIISPLSTDALKEPENKQQVEQKTLPLSLEYASCLVYLAVFGILGVLTRYLLQKLFGPGVAGVTSDWSILYLDLPSNMVGSFLMGWFGVVFKADIAKSSDHLAIALTTGYLGSLTTFSGWNQKMLDLTVSGQWVFAVLGFLIGLFLAAYSIIFGIETAKGFRWFLNKLNTKPGKENHVGDGVWKTNGLRHHVAGMLAMLLVLGALWSLSAVLLKDNFSNGGSGAQLWLACLVGPVGVWIRWFLARLNGRGLGKPGILKWIPFGTLIANVSAAVVMAALATIKKAVNSERCDTVASGLQFGLMGCLSTVSTFMAEFNAMRESKHPWRAYVYAVMTVVLSFAFGILVYDVPVWTEGYDHN